MRCRSLSEQLAIPVQSARAEEEAGLNGDLSLVRVSHLFNELLSCLCYTIFNLPKSPKLIDTPGTSPSFPASFVDCFEGVEQP